MIFVDYHNHTSLCCHAEGSIDEYIESAIDKGIIELGFSDHAPLPLPYREGITMNPDETESYISEIIKKKEEYKSRIKIRLGFEVDYPIFDTFSRNYLTDSRIDYLIGSCHFLKDWPFDHPDFIEEFTKRDINNIYDEYYSILKEMTAEKLFNIIGHFDLVKKFGHRATSDFSNTIEAIAKNMAKNDIAFEINSAGKLKPVGEIYPSIDIIKIMFNCNVPVTFGSDSHHPENVGYMFSEIITILKQIGYRKISGFQNRKRYDIKF